MDSCRQASSPSKKNCTHGVETPLREALCASSSSQSVSIKTSQFLFTSMFYLYKGLIGPALQALGGPTMGCRYPQSCSEYAHESLLNLGWAQGTWMSFKRILSCNPWSLPKAELMFVNSSINSSPILWAHNKDKLS